jgi:predicted ABC-type ATPase
MNKVAFIIRGTSGSGKSILAQSLSYLNPNSVICEADDFFIDSWGGYYFNPNKLGEAHQWCKNKFQQALDNGVEVVICSNTNTSKKEYQFYVDKAKLAGYIVHVITAERFMDTKSVHNVPQEVLDKQVERMRLSIQF